MSYIGSTPTTQSFISGTDSFNGTGSQTNFTLSRFVNSVNDVQVVVNNVVQYPPNYSVSGNTLTISPAPSAGTNNVYVRYLSTTLQSIAPSQGIGIQFGTGSAALPSISFIGDTNTGIYSPAADTIAFAEGGVEAMRIDSSGNVGIGTSSPDNKLHVSQASSDFQVRVTGTSAANAGAIRAYNAGGEASVFGTTGSSNTGYGANLGVLGTVTNIPQVFVTNNTERARIDSSGTLIVNSTSKQNGDVKFSVTANSGAAIETKFTADYYPLLIYRSGNLYGNIYQSGTSTAFNTSSDYRLKENIQPMINALSTIAALKPCRYTWKFDGSDGQGFIAHELQEIMPDCVTGEKDAMEADGVTPRYQGIDTSFLVATLTAAIQEQQAMIDTMKQEIAELKAKVGE